MTFIVSKQIVHLVTVTLYRICHTQYGRRVSV